MIEEKMLEKRVWAVVGANVNPEKFGNMIYKKLKTKGYETFAVNPIYEKIDGDLSYKNIASLPKLPDVINIVVSPKRAKPIIEEAAKLGVKYVWFQPGTYDDETLRISKQLGLEIAQACVLVATR